MKLFVFFVVTTINLTLFGQIEKNSPELACEGLKTAPFTSFITLNGLVQKGSIRKEYLGSNILQIHLGDTSFKVIGFYAIYDCHSGSLTDMNSKKYQGNFIRAGDPFINRIRVGDYLVLDCINIEKNGNRYLVKSCSFQIF